MCLPMIGAAVGAIGAIATGMAQASVAKYNAKVAEINAQTAIQEGFAQAGQTRDQYSELEGEQRAAITKAGVDPGSTTAFEIHLDTAKKRNLAFQTDIWRGQTEKVKYQNQAKQFKAEAKAAMVSGVIGGFSSMLGGFDGAKMGGAGTPLTLKQRPMFAGV